MKKSTLAGIVGAVLVIAGLLVWQFTRLDSEPTPQVKIEEKAQDQPFSATSSVPKIDTATKPFTIPIAAGEQISDWSIRGVAPTPASMAKAQENIAKSLGLLGSGKYPDYVLYVDIANQYNSIGDGKNELIFLEKALALDSAQTGLAWHNAGQLFRRLGAFRTARYAFEQAAAAQPIGQYLSVLDDFLAEHPEIGPGQ
ncbi:tetratricopeptide repeat protein [Candidatus Kaiserbacteria bacterium]|nr:tetratricopeptide repeat protein [Candidatus Kaiserbacteria bacterium]